MRRAVQDLELLRFIGGSVEFTALRDGDGFVQVSVEEQDRNVDRCDTRLTTNIVESREILARQTSDKFSGEYTVVVCERCLEHAGKGDLWAYVKVDGSTEIFYLYSRDRQYAGRSA